VCRDRPLVQRAIVVGAAAVAAVGLRRWQLRWGASRDEVARQLPGDDIVVAPQYSATNAITIGGAPGAVWPWLVQMGAYGRAGWYAFDHLDNAGVTSSWEIVPELQNLKVGDVMATDRSGEGFVVEAIDPTRSLVLSIRSAEGVTSSALVLEPTSNGRTRLLLRLRLRVGRTPRGLGYRAIMEIGHVIMTRKTLSGIKARVERHAELEANAVPAEGVAAPLPELNVERGSRPLRQPRPARRPGRPVSRR